METDRERLRRIYAEKKLEDEEKIKCNDLDYKQLKRRQYYLANRNTIIANQAKRYEQKDKDNKKEYYENNKEKFKEYYQKNKIEITETRRKNYPQIREKHLERNRIWRANNKDKVKEANIRKKEKKQTDYINRQKIFLASVK